MTTTGKYSVIIDNPTRCTVNSRFLTILSYLTFDVVFCKSTSGLVRGRVSETTNTSYQEQKGSWISNHQSINLLINFKYWPFSGVPYWCLRKRRCSRRLKWPPLPLNESRTSRLKSHPLVLRRLRVYSRQDHRNPRQSFVVSGSGKKRVPSQHKYDISLIMYNLVYIFQFFLLIMRHLTLACMYAFISKRS